MRLLTLASIPDLTSKTWTTRSFLTWTLNAKEMKRVSQIARIDSVTNVSHSAKTWYRIRTHIHYNTSNGSYCRDQSARWDSQLSHKKMKTMFLSNMSKSRRLTSTFFPIIWKCLHLRPIWHLLSSRLRIKGKILKNSVDKNMRFWASTVNTCVTSNWYCVLTI